MKINFKLAAAIFCRGNTVLLRQLPFAVANFEGCYFKDQPVYRCEVQEMRRLNYIFEIFYCNLHYYKHLLPKFMNISVQWFQEMTVNTATWLNLREQFFKGFKIIFQYYTERAFVLLQGCFKKAGIQFKRNNMLRDEDKVY